MFSQCRADRRPIPCVQKLGLQDLRIKHRWEVMAEDNRMRAVQGERLEYKPEILSCGDTLKQLMVDQQVACKKAE